MKKISLLLGTFIALFFISCEGPTGPPGPPGYDGKDGDVFEAMAFEIQVDMRLNKDGVYEFAEAFSDQGITIAPDDVILIYRLEDIVAGLDVWRQLPQPIFTAQGLLYYNFDFTQKNYVIYVEPEFDPALVQQIFIRDQIYRIVVVPANLEASTKMDQSNIQDVMSTLNISEKEVQRFDLN